MFLFIPQPMFFVAVKHSVAADWLKINLKKETSRKFETETVKKSCTHFIRKKIFKLFHFSLLPI